MAQASSVYVDVTGEINKRGIVALNVDKRANQENLFIGDKSLVCRSDSDAQMLLGLPFNNAVKLFAILLEAPAGEQPTLLKVSKYSSSMLNKMHSFTDIC
jgi:hypothetical protein